jgi:diadenylate cyclase
LHDGAVIVQKDRIAAAACFLPLTTNAAISLKLGTRHRAAIGITEETDCLSLVVSEETGLISVAAFGELQQGLTIGELETRINRHFGVPKLGSASSDARPSDTHPSESDAHLSDGHAGGGHEPAGSVDNARERVNP